jgi:hypothetical protein
LTVYVDGWPGTPGSIASLGDCSNAEPLVAGALLSGGGNFLDGQISGVRVWKEARTQDQIRESMLRQIPDPIAETGLKMYLKFSELEGIATIYDSTANAHDGTLVSITASSWVAGPYVDTPAMVALRQIQHRMQVPWSLIDSDAFWTLHDDAPYPIGWWGRAEKAKDAITDILSSVWAGWGISRAGLVTVGQITDPASGTSVLTITEDDMPGEPTEVDVPSPAWRIDLGFKHNWHPIRSDELVLSGLTDQETEDLSTEWRHAIISDTKAQKAITDSTDLGLVPSYLMDEADARTEAKRRLAIWNRPQQMFRIPVTTAIYEQVEIWKVVTWEYDRHGLQGGAQFLVAGVRENASLGAAELLIWRPV